VGQLVAYQNFQYNSAPGARGQQVMIVCKICQLYFNTELIAQKLVVDPLGMLCKLAGRTTS
jgi:hypothetical protein